MRRAIATVLALGVAFALSTAAHAEPLKIVSENPPVAPGYDRFVLHSDRIGRDFTVTVNTPAATVFLPGQKLPAVYALDSGYGMAGAQGVLLGNTGAMAPAIIISVGYPPGQGAHRNDDLSHAKITQGPMTFGGGGAAFEAFLLQDLKPWVEAKYPADPARSVLFGHSLGGLFAARVFAHNPNAYAAYVIGSASVWADPEVAAAVAQAAPAAKDVRVYLTVGELEDPAGGPPRMLSGFKALAAAMKGHPGIALKSQVYAGETHLSYYPRLVTDGFPVVLPPLRPLNFRDLPLPDAVMQRYVGVYALPDGRTLTIRIPDRPPGAPPMLQAQVTGIVPVPLLQNGKDRFYNPTSDIDATFDGVGLTMVADNARMRVEKVKPAP
jgi:predicted alpha/beta superfamily hydrolase